MVKSANTLQARGDLRSLFSRGSSTRSVRSAEKKNDLNVAKVPRNHRVRFVDDNVQEKPSEGPLTDEEKKLCYYNEDDLYNFDRDRALTALMYRTRRKNGISWDDDQNSVRGLEEIWLKEKKQDIRRRHVMKVLTAQKQEILAGREPDPEVLGEISLKASKECRQRAVTLGKEDSVAAGTRNRSLRNHRKSPNTSPIINTANKVKKKLALWTHQDKEQLRWSH